MMVPHFVLTTWWYFHNHLQDNILASGVWAVLGYLFGRYHINKLHRKIDIIHQHLKETRNI